MKIFFEKEEKTMVESVGMLESVGIGIFMMCVVFAVLTGIYFCVRIFSAITMKVEDNFKSNDSQTTE